jgi:hypothetical protein
MSSMPSPCQNPGQLKLKELNTIGVFTTTRDGILHAGLSVWRSWLRRRNLVRVNYSWNLRWMFLDSGACPSVRDYEFRIVG